ncbi:MAG TPA: archease [Bryobacteraceae bacterium]|nr:archease [Bryobacteraceae bacterium]
MPGTFEILEHPADIGFRAFGFSLPALFANAALALLSIAGDPAAAEPRHEYRLAVESGDRESLLVDWLSEVLYWWDGKRVAFHEFRIGRFTDQSLEAVALGEPREAVRHQAKVIVKAVTYHQLKIERVGANWIAEVYLDV